MQLGCVTGHTLKIHVLLSGHPIKGQNHSILIIFYNNNHKKYIMNINQFI